MPHARAPPKPGRSRKSRGCRRFERVQVVEPAEEAVEEPAAAADLLLIWCCADDGDVDVGGARAEDARCWRTVLLVVVGATIPLLAGVLLYYSPGSVDRKPGTVHGIDSPPPPASFTATPPAPPPPPPHPPPSPATKAHWVNPIDVPDNSVEAKEAVGCNCAFAEGGCSDNDQTLCWQLCCR